MWKRPLRECPIVEKKGFSCDSYLNIYISRQKININTNQQNNIFSQHELLYWSHYLFMIPQNWFNHATFYWGAFVKPGDWALLYMRLGLSILSVTTIVRFNFQTVLTVVVFLFIVRTCHSPNMRPIYVAI